MIRMTRARRVTAIVALTLAALPVLSAVTPVAGARSGQAVDGPFRVVGQLPEPKGPLRFGAGSIVAVDSPGRRLYYAYQANDLPHVMQVVTYDLRSRIPKQIAIGPLVRADNVLNPSPTVVSLDTRRQRLIFVTGNVNAADRALPVANAKLTVFNAKTQKVDATWDLATTVPGFYPMATVYSAADDRLYMVGEFSGSGFVTTVPGSLGKPAGSAPGVVAINPANGALLWARQIAECQQPLYNFDSGSMIARSTASNSLYFACVSGGTSSGQTYPGQSGLIRLNIDPKGTAADAATFPMDFFPISGSYFRGSAASGISAFDHTTDRFYMQSIAKTTPGDWVFDGRLGAWVGFVSSVDSTDFFVGVNEGLGHLYIGTNNGGASGAKDGLIVSDVRQTPVPQGDFEPLVPSAMIPTDNASNRLFVRPPDTAAQYSVVEDLSPVTHGEVAHDYDAETTNTPDTPAANVSYIASAAGFGAQSIQVGGTNSPVTGVSQDQGNVGGGTRAFMTARSGGILLSDSGATASGQAALADATSEQAYEGLDPNGGDPSDHLEWPYEQVACLDSTGEKVDATDKDTSTGGDATIRCDKTGNVARTRVTMGPSGTGGANVHRSSFTAEATRTAKDGAVVTATATAEGTVLGVDGGVSVRINRVVATSTSTAHGRPGTTRSFWTRTVSGVEVLDITGKPLPLAAGGCSSTVTVLPGKGLAATDTCKQFADVINKLLPSRLKVSFPMPNAIATPKGARSAIEQADADYFQQSVVNDQGVIYRGDSIGLRPVPSMVTETYTDTTERSRTVTVLAALETSAILTITPPFDYGDFNDGGGAGGSGGSGGTGGTNLPGITPGTTGDHAGRVDDPQLVGPGGVSRTSPATALRGFLFMKRSLRDIALLVLLAGLMLGGAGTAWRRRRLVEVLVTVPRRETP